MPGACGLRPCARTHHKKGLVPHLPVGWSGQQIPRLTTSAAVQIILAMDWFWTGPLQVLGSALAGRVVEERIWPSVSRCLGNSFGLRGPSSQAFTPFGEVGFIARHLRGRRHFLGNAGRVWATALRPDPPKKRPCATLARKVGRATNTSADYFQIRYRGKMVFLILAHVHDLHFNKTYTYPPNPIQY